MHQLSTLCSAGLACEAVQRRLSWLNCCISFYQGGSVRRTASGGRLWGGSSAAALPPRARQQVMNDCVTRGGAIEISKRDWQLYSFWNLRSVVNEIPLTDLAQQT